MNKVFVYGSLKRNYWNHRVLEQSNGKFVKEDQLSGASIYNYSSFPALGFIEGKNPVQGEVFEVERMDYLDRLEGYPNFYNRSLVKTDSGEEVWVYHFNTKPSGSLIESGCWPSQTND
jgi:gamma-glutamylcyclotransferase (GGCT)/AIG2-like uncharacterized protein YtfP